MSAAVLERHFRPLHGRPCWGVRTGHANNLTLEFGDPHLEVREPKRSESPSPRVRRLLARRRVFVHGAWHLWVRSADWSLRLRGGRTTTSAAPDPSVVAELDGEALVSCAVHPRTLRMVLRFDLGAALTVTRPAAAEDDDELWSLYLPRRTVLTLRADGRYCHGRSDAPADEQAWRKLPSQR